MRRRRLPERVTLPSLIGAAEVADFDVTEGRDVVAVEGFEPVAAAC